MLESRDVFVLFHFQVLQVVSGKVPKQKAKPKAAPLSEPVLAGKTVAEKVALVRGKLIIMLEQSVLQRLVFLLCMPKQRMPARLLTATLVKLTKFFQKLGAYHLFFSACSHFEKRRFCVDYACTLTDKSS